MQYLSFSFPALSAQNEKRGHFERRCAIKMISSKKTLFSTQRYKVKEYKFYLI